MLAGAVYVGVGLLYSGFQGVFFGRDEGLIYMVIFIAQGIGIAGVGMALKEGRVILTNSGISVRSSKAKFEIEWSNLEQVKIEPGMIRFWDDKGLKTFPTDKLAEQDRMTLVNYLQDFQMGYVNESSGLTGFGERETQF